jgi:hypothetical protein
VIVAPFIKNWTSYDTSVTAWLTAIPLLGMGLVFEWVEGQWTFQAGDNRVLGDVDPALRGGSNHAFATEEHSWIGAAEEGLSKHGGVDAALLRRV